MTQPPEPGGTRRTLLRLGVALAVVGVVTARPWRGLFSSLHFEPVEQMPGFRRLLGASGASAQISGAQTALLGLPDPTEDALRPSAAHLAQIRSDPVSALFAAHDADTLGIAYFTDIRCPICGRVERDLTSLLQEDPGLALTTHEYPIFGESSIAAARYILAAGEMGQAEALRTRLRRGASLGGISPEQAAQAVGLDPSVLIQRAEQDDITQRLQLSRGLASLFGFSGTPALVIGHTAILGARPIQTLRDVIASERE